MFFYQKELDRLNAMFLSSKSSLTLVNGLSGVGKTELIERFSNEKKVYFYAARKIASNLQMASNEQNRSFDSWSKLFEFQKNSFKDSKLVIIIDNFEFLYKSDINFIQELLEFYAEYESKNILIILSNNSSIIKKELLDQEKSNFYLNSKTIDLKPLYYRQIKRLFPNRAYEELLKIYAITGGIYRYLELFENSDFETVVVNNFLTKKKNIQSEVELLLLNELRDLSTYNIFLTLLAKNINILNELHKNTGAERAKISVYLNNLIALDIVGKDENLRASYYISNNLVKFYFRFIFPNLSFLLNRDPRQLFKSLIEPFLNDYLEDSLKIIAREFLEFQDSIDLLPFKIDSINKYQDKNTTIDWVFNSNNGEYLFANCFYISHPLDVDAFYVLNSRATKINDNQNNNYYYLFSNSGFTEQLMELSKSNKKIRLINLENIFNT